MNPGNRNPKAKDITGTRRGKLTAIAQVGVYRRKSAIWALRCDCGNTLQRIGSYFLTGYMQDCGCGKLLKPAPAEKKAAYRQLFLNGERITLQALADLAGLKLATVATRSALGWDAQRILDTPARPKSPPKPPPAAPTRLPPTFAQAVFEDPTLAGRRPIRKDGTP